MKTRYVVPALLVVLLALSGGSAFGQTEWIKYVANPVVTAPGPWYQGAWSPCVLYNPDSSRFEMWFVGSSGALGDRPCRVGHAVSTNGVSWTVRSTPVLSPEAGKWDSYSVEAPYVIRENGQYKMWYTGTTDFLTFRIGYATSPDGIAWTKHPANPVFGADPENWELIGAGYCSVMPSNGRYKMWYTSGSAIGANEYIGYAESPDGLQWQRDTLNNPVLGPGGVGQWDGFMTALPRVLKAGDLHYMWYLGSTTLFSGLRGGLATSRDGVTNWVKHQGNPVLQPSPGQWDGADVEIGSVIFVGDSLYLYYDGNGTRFQIGLAKCRFSPIVSGITATPQVVDFGRVLVGASSDTVEVEVKNMGLHALTVTSVMVDGMAFSLSNVPSLPVALAPSDSLAFGVFFHPAMYGNADA
ncbi:MAG TPA: hypothetical protein VLT13_14960 [Bacteroidota bacterium]|nr:hypothetical protein [Bacteroidota bacterium]